MVEETLLQASINVKAFVTWLVAVFSIKAAFFLDFNERQLKKTFIFVRLFVEMDSEMLTQMKGKGKFFRCSTSL